MKKILAYLKSNIYIFLLLLVSFVTFVPTLYIRFSWIDDGWDILVAKNMIQSFLHLDISAVVGGLVETSIGRFRPMYWLWQTSVYSLGGSSSFVHFLLHFVLLFLICVLIYKLIFHFTKSKISGFAGSLLFMLIPLNTENWIRLGPAEPLMIFFMLLSLFVYFKNNNVKLSVILMALSFLTKETAIAIVPAFILYIVLKIVCVKQIKDEFRLGAYFIVLSIFSVIISLLNRKGYSNSYVFDLSTSIYNFKFYLRLIKNILPVGILFIYTLMLRSIRPIVNFKIKSIKSLEVIKLFFLISFFAFVAIQAPWAWVLNRYLMPALAMGSIFVGLELYSLIQFFQKHKLSESLFKTTLLLYSMVFVVYSYVAITEQITRQRHATESVYQILKVISEKAPKDGTVYFNFKNNDATYEPLFESDIHLKLFLNRTDVKVDFLENVKPTDTNYMVVSGTPLGSFKETDDKKLVMNKKLIKYDSYTNQSRFLVLSNIKTVTKQFVKNTFNGIKNTTKITSEGIYTDYLLKDDWRIYYY